MTQQKFPAVIPVALLWINSKYCSLTLNGYKGFFLIFLKFQNYTFMQSCLGKDSGLLSYSHKVLRKYLLYLP